MDKGIGSLGPTELAQLLLIAVVVVVLVFSSSFVGLSLTQSESTSLGDGNATVTAVSVDVTAVQITPGRFGTDVSYLRIPDAQIDIDDLEGQPRLVYRVEVPALDLDLAATKLIQNPGPTTVRLSDAALAADQLDADSYEGRVTVRVQSLSSDYTVFNESATIEVTS